MKAIPEEYSIEIRNRFETSMAVQEMTPYEMAIHTRDVFIYTAWTMSPLKK